MPIEDSIGALSELRDRGLIGNIGVSNVRRDQLARARAAGPIVAVQNRYNLTARADDNLIDQLAAAGIGYVPHGPLDAHPARADAPLASHPTLAAIARRHGAIATQIALAWLLQRSPNILLIPGTTSLEHLQHNIAAADITLTAADLADLDKAHR